MNFMFYDGCISNIKPKIVAKNVNKVDNKENNNNVPRIFRLNHIFLFLSFHCENA